MEILWAVLVLLGLGLLFGLGLAIAAVILHVKEDEAIVTGKEQNLKKCKPGKEDLNFKPIIEYLDRHPNEDGSKVNVHL